MGLLRRPLLLLALLAALAPGAAAHGQDAAATGPAAAPAADAALPDGAEIARRINARDEGRQTSRTLVMELIEPDGFTRTRETRFFRRSDDEGRKLAIFYESPKTLEGTAFLTHDHPDPERDDDLWLYLPALRKVRRIAISDRGRAFLATDLSYEDVKLETRVSETDYRFRTLGETQEDGARRLVVEAVPVDDATAHALGYGRVELQVDPETWLVRRAEYADPAGRPLKTAVIEGVRAVDGIQTPHRIRVESHRTGHRTVFRFDDVDYTTELPESLFTPRALRRGPP
jgi:hypothetical protein